MKTKKYAILLLLLIFVMSGVVHPAFAGQPLQMGGPRIMLADGTVIPVDIVDLDRAPGQLAVYTRHYGERTKPFASQTAEYIVADGVVVEQNINGRNGTFIPTNGFVLSASGAAAEALGSLDTGTQIRTEGIDIPLLPSKYVTVSGITVGIDAENRTRGAGEVILYRSSYGTSTRQNPWGMEISVSGGKITRVAEITYDPITGSYLDNDSPIPAEGYVVSIQSGSLYYDRLAGRVAVGDAVELVTDSLIYSAGKISFDAYNPKSREDNPGGWDDANNQPYPGYRGADQLIIYDSSYGSSTGTNPWGFEAVVSDKGIVSHSGGNNSPIPDGGHVLSGHGVKNAWLTNRAIVGAKVLIDRAAKQVLIIFTPESYLHKAEIAIAGAEQALLASRSKFLDVPYEEIGQKIAAANQLYERAKTALESGETSGLSDLLNTLDENISDTAFMNYESRKVDVRGLWLRPKETNAEQVRVNLRKIKDANINSVYLETWWDGYTIYPTENPDSAQNPLYGGFDVLKAYIEEGSKLGIEIHAWVENFFAGGPVVAKHPDWLIVSRKGDHFEEGTNGAPWYWLNPALPQARDFVSSIYRELLEKYDVASLHLDYTRYPGSGDYTNDFGYDVYTRGLFKQRAGVDPIDLHPGDTHWEEWLQFRADIINTWVDRVVQEAHQVKPDLFITAAVWPNYDEAPKSLGQQAVRWIESNRIDNLFHMSYVPDASIIAEDAGKSQQIAQGRAFVTSGIGTFIGLTKGELVRQIDTAIRTGADGTALFEFESLFDNNYNRELKLGVYRNAAFMPDYRTTKPAAVMLADIRRKIDGIYLPFEGMKEPEAGKLKQSLTAAVSILQPERAMNHGIATAVKQSLNHISRQISGSASINSEVKERMMFDLNFVNRMLELYLAKEKQL